jgi:hypothetical protein
MDDTKRKEYEAFLRIHHPKAPVTSEPVAHLMWKSKIRGPDDPFIALTRDEVVEALDTSSETVQWLLEQMRTYEPTRQRIVGLVFGRGEVMSDVLRQSD